MSRRRNSMGQFGKVRTPPEDLEWRAPDCPYCNKETDSDGDSLRCYNCDASWSMDGRRGQWDDPTELACVAAIEWFNTDGLESRHESIRHEVETCVLPDDHGGAHQGADSWYRWHDGDPRVVKRGAPA